MADDLLGYLLGALDGAEQVTIREKLADDAELRAELLELEARLAPLEIERWSVEPPPRLAERTCAFIFGNGDSADQPSSAGQSTPIAAERHTSQRTADTDRRVISPRLSPTRSAEAPAESSRYFSWTMTDLSLMAGLTVAAVCLLAPALLNNREAARLAQCQDNLRSLGIAMPIWSGVTNGYLPSIPATGNAAAAGFYAPQLMRAGIVGEDKTFVCPTSSFASNSFHVPAISSIYAAKGAELVRLQRQMGGSYYYGLGYVAGKELLGRRMTGSNKIPLLAEGANSHGSNQQWRSGQVINVLYEDGHVKRLFIPARGGNRGIQDASVGGSLWQDMFVSDRGIVEAGRNESDVVLAPSWARPFPYALANSLMYDPTPMDVQSILDRIDPHQLNVGLVLERDQPTSPYPWVLEYPR